MKNKLYYKDPYMTTFLTKLADQHQDEFGMLSLRRQPSIRQVEASPLTQERSMIVRSSMLRK
jgi:hypothetical protein